MDDGYSFNINQKRYYVFSTHSFPLEDHEILVKALRGNFSIEATFKSNILSIDYIFGQNKRTALSI